MRITFILKQQTRSHSLNTSLQTRYYSGFFSLMKSESNISLVKILIFYTSQKSHLYKYFLHTDRVTHSLHKQERIILSRNNISEQAML